MGTDFSTWRGNCVLTGKSFEPFKILTTNITTCPKPLEQKVFLRSKLTKLKNLLNHEEIPNEKKQQAKVYYEKLIGQVTHNVQFTNIPRRETVVRSNFTESQDNEECALGACILNRAFKNRSQSYLLQILGIIRPIWIEYAEFESGEYRKYKHLRDHYDTLHKKRRKLD